MRNISKNSSVSNIRLAHVHHAEIVCAGNLTVDGEGERTVLVRRRARVATAVR